jgi:hypothetical protein
MSLEYRYTESCIGKGTRTSKGTGGPAVFGRPLLMSFFPSRQNPVSDLLPSPPPFQLTSSNSDREDLGKSRQSKCRILKLKAAIDFPHMYRCGLLLRAITETCISIFLGVLLDARCAPIYHRLPRTCDVLHRLVSALGAS